MDKLPRRPKQHVSAGKAICAAKGCLPSTWIVREEPQDLDYGIDLEIEIASDYVTGRLFKVQVKGHEKVGWSASNEFFQAIREETLNYWNAIPLPVVLIMVDHEARKTYWAPGKRSDRNKGVRIAKEDSLPATIENLRTYVIDWLDARGEWALLYALPQYHQAWQRIKESIGYDFFLPVEREEYLEIELFYRQTVLYRDISGCAVDLLPWPLWISRSRVTLGDNENLYWGTYDEVVAYLEPIVSEIINYGRKRLLAEEPQVNNLTARCWANNYSIEDRIVYGFERAPREFWAKVDQKLDRAGALNLKAAEGTKFRKR